MGGYLHLRHKSSYQFQHIIHPTCICKGIDGVYNKQVMHVYHVITHLYKGSINRRQPYSKIKSISNIVNRTIRCAIHGCHQIIIGSIACSQSPPPCEAFYLTVQLSMPSVVHKTIVLSIFLEYSRIVHWIPPPTTESWLLVEYSCEITSG